MPRRSWPRAAVRSRMSTSPSSASGRKSARIAMPWWHVSPRTWPSLAALPLAWAIAGTFGAPALVLAAGTLFVAGWWAAERVERMSGITDNGIIVVDEVVGQWLTLAVAPLHPLAYLGGFLLF